VAVLRGSGSKDIINRLRLKTAHIGGLTSKGLAELVSDEGLIVNGLNWKLQGIRMHDSLLEKTDARRNRQMNRDRGGTGRLTEQSDLAGISTKGSNIGGNPTKHLLLIQHSIVSLCSANSEKSKSSQAEEHDKRFVQGAIKVVSLEVVAYR
jgi:hypothetical protein